MEFPILSDLSTKPMLSAAPYTVSSVGAVASRNFDLLTIGSRAAHDRWQLYQCGPHVSVQQRPDHSPLLICSASSGDQKR